MTCASSMGRMPLCWKSSRGWARRVTLEDKPPCRTLARVGRVASCSEGQSILLCVINLLILVLDPWGLPRPCHPLHSQHLSVCFGEQGMVLQNLPCALPCHAQPKRAAFGTDLGFTCLFLSAASFHVCIFTCAGLLRRGLSQPQKTGGGLEF